MDEFLMFTAYYPWLICQLRRHPLFRSLRRARILPRRVIRPAS